MTNFSEENPQMLKPGDIKHNILAVKINRTYPESAEDDHKLYDAVRGSWIVDKNKLESIDYVFGLYKSLIVAVYKPTEWFMSVNDTRRVSFVDKDFEEGHEPDENEKFYLGKSVADLGTIRQSQSAVNYLQPSAS